MFTNVFSMTPELCLPGCSLGSGLFLRIIMCVCMSEGFVQDILVEGNVKPGMEGGGGEGGLHSTPDQP